MYGDDLVYVHEAGFTALAEAAGRMVVESFPPCAVLDVGCGGGTLSEMMAEAGFDVTGIDVSQAMVEHARHRTDKAHFHQMDLRKDTLPETTGITAVGEVLSYACADVPLEQVARRMAATGVQWMLFDVAAPGRAEEDTRFDRRGKDWRVTAYAGTAGVMLERRIITEREVRGDWRRSEETHTLRLLSETEIRGAFEPLGFTVEPLGGYDDWMFQTGWDGYLLRRTG